jgi:hypothetical protein
MDVVSTRLEIPTSFDQFPFYHDLKCMRDVRKGDRSERDMLNWLTDEARSKRDDLTKQKVPPSSPLPKENN